MVKSSSESDDKKQQDEVNLQGATFQGGKNTSYNINHQIQDFKLERMIKFINHSYKN